MGGLLNSNGKNFAHKLNDAKNTQDVNSCAGWKAS